MRKFNSLRRYSFHFKASLIVILFLALLNAGCNKKSDSENIEDELIAKKEEQKKQTSSKEGITLSSVPIYCEDLENPCTDPACAPYYDCESLAESLANHQSFINLNSYFDQALNMPDPDSFTYYFDTAQLRLQGDPYLSNLTGYSISSIDGINDGIIANLQNLQSSFPELSNIQVFNCKIFFLKLQIFI